MSASVMDHLHWSWIYYIYRYVNVVKEWENVGLRKTQHNTEIIMDIVLIQHPLLVMSNTGLLALLQLVDLGTPIYGYVNLLWLGWAYCICIYIYTNTYIYIYIYIDSYIYIYICLYIYVIYQIRYIKYIVITYLHV